MFLREEMITKRNEMQLELLAECDAKIKKAYETMSACEYANYRDAARDAYTKLSNMKADAIEQSYGFPARPVFGQEV